MEVAVRLVVSALDLDLAVFHLRRDAVVHRVGKLTELALNRHLLTVDRGGDAIDDLDGFFTDSRHCL